MRTIKHIVLNNSKNTDSLSKTGVYKIRCLNCNKSYEGEARRNLNKIIYEYKKDFKTGVTTKIFSFS